MTDYFFSEQNLCLPVVSSIVIGAIFLHNVVTEFEMQISKMQKYLPI